MMRPDAIVIRDDDTLADLDANLARLAIWRHESPEAEARFEALLDERCQHSDAQ